MQLQQLLTKIRHRYKNFIQFTEEDMANFDPKLMLHKDVAIALNSTDITEISFTGAISGTSIDDLAIMLNALKDTKVDAIDLSTNNLNDRSADDLAKILGALKNTKVTTINLFHNNLGFKLGDQLATILRALKGTNVSTIDLSGNNLAIKSSDELATMLSALKETEVTTINLSSNFFTMPASDFAKILSTLKDTKVTTIILAGNNFSNYTGTELATMLNGLKDTKVTSIDLTFNSLGFKSVDELTTILRGLNGTKVTTINLSSNVLDRKTSSELAAMLGALKDTNVTTIDLSRNNLSRKTGAELATMLGALKDTNVTTINLSKNNFESKTDDELESILAAIPCVYIAGIDNPVVHAHNLLVPIRQKLLQGDYFFDDIEWPEVYFTDKNKLELIVLLQERGGSLGALTAASLLAAVPPENAQIVPKNNYARIIDLLLQSTSNPHLLPVARHLLANLKMRMVDIDGKYLVSADIKKRFEQVAVHLKPALLYATDFEDEMKYIENPGFYFLQGANQDNARFEQDNLEKLNAFLTENGFAEFNGNNINNFNSKNMTPMMAAIQAHDYENCLRLFYFGKATLNLTNPGEAKDTLLHFAFAQYDPNNVASKKIITWLLENGADLDIPNANGKTSRDIARESAREFLLTRAYIPAKVANPSNLLKN